MQVDDGGLSLKQLVHIGNRNIHCKRLSLPEHRLNYIDALAEGQRGAQASGGTDKWTDRQTDAWLRESADAPVLRAP